MDTTSTRWPYPTGESIQVPPAIPLRNLSGLSSKKADESKIDSNPPSYDDESSPYASAQRRKRESYSLAGSVFLITEHGQMLKLPTPSDSPADPLGWKKWQRAGAFIAITCYMTVSLAVAQAAGVLMRVITVDFGSEDIPPWQLEWLVTAPVLFMGLGGFLWVPLTIGMGRRPVFLIASTMLFASTLAAGYSQTFSQLLACVCLLSFGGGFAVTASFLIIIDIAFIHERPKAIAILWALAGFFGTGFVAIVPYVSSAGQKWRLYYQYWSLAALASVSLVFFLLPETYFKRPTVAFDGLIVLQSATEKLTVFRDVAADANIYRDLPKLPNERGIMGRFNFWRSPFASWTSMGRSYPQIAFCAINPLIFWVTIASAASFSGTMFIGSTFPRVLGAAPYNLSSESITLLNLSNAVGGLLAYPLGVLPVQKILDRLARRNKGVREAEHYLIGLILPVITGALSTLIYGLAAHNSFRLGAFYIANGLNGYSNIAFAISTTMWVTEAFPRWAAPALTVMTGGSYIICFCVLLGLAPWIASHSYNFVGIELTVLQIVFGLIAVPIAFWGKSARQAIHGRWAEERGGALRPL